MNIDPDELMAIIGRLYTENWLLQKRVRELTPPPVPPPVPPATPTP